jgi:hypothetical protein
MRAGPETECLFQKRVALIGGGARENRKNARIGPGGVSLLKGRMMMPADVQIGSCIQVFLWHERCCGESSWHF